MPDSFDKCRAKMEAEGIAPSAISAFESTFKALVSGATGLIPEDTIMPAPDLDRSDDFTLQPDTSLLSQTVVLKLNGGLGTGMGLDKAKSLLKVKGDDTFLDLTAKQVIQMRKEFGQKVKFMLMNSFSTSADTLAFLKEKYPELASEDGLEMMQNKVPKLDAETFEPAVCPSNPENEWCPPGHGDLYAALVGSGSLDRLLKDGFKYMFVSNSDNLGASLDLKILSYYAQKNAPFMMECCERTENDKKGGHLAVRKSDKQLVLRESAMCADEDEKAFQDISKHRFFNTNNLWIRLDKLQEIIVKNKGFIPLPMIMNKKTVDPKNDKSQKVVQLETAMGAAIECFEGATAIVVPRTRFAPVKKCNDLLLLRSDAYIIEDNKPVLNPACGGKAPVISLDSKLYKLVGALEEATAEGIPSLVHCTRLTLKGPVHMSSATNFFGDVSIVNSGKEPKLVPPGDVTGDVELIDDLHPKDEHNMAVLLFEPAPNSGVLTQDGITQIAHHKYKAGEYTWLDLKLNPIWQGLTELLPMDLAPNAVTAIGGLFCLAGYLLSWYFNPNFDQQVPSWLLVANGLATIIYFTADCMDGKQARRTGSSSPLGQLFDHGVDCLTSIFHASTFQCWSCVPPTSMLKLQMILMFSFWCAQWEEYYTGVLPHSTCNIGVTEVVYGLGSLSIVMAFIDRDALFSTTLHSLLSNETVLRLSRLNDVILKPFFNTSTDELQVRDLLSITWYWFSTGLIVLSICRVLAALHKTPERQFVAMAKLVNPFLLALAPLLLQTEVIERDIRYITLAVGLVFAFISIKIIVFSMAKQVYAIVQFDTFPVFVTVLWVMNDGRWKEKGIRLLWKLLSVLYLRRLHRWASSASRQICQRMQIHLFSIVKQKTD